MDERHHESTAEDLLDRVARQARGDEAAGRERDERLKRLAEGTLGDDELAALRHEAETSDEARADLEMFSPLGDEFQHEVLRDLQARTRPEGDRQARRDPGWLGWLGTLHTLRPPLAVALVVATLLIAGTAAWLAVSLDRSATAGFELASYESELSGQLRDQRGPGAASDELPTFGPDSTFRVVFTPETEPEQTPQFAFYFASEDGEFMRWSSFSQSDGAVKIESRVSELPLEPGVWTLFFVYGQPGTLPDPSGAGDLAPVPRDPWRSKSVTFRIVSGDVASHELPLEVLYRGCFDVVPGPTCLTRRTLVVWARSLPDADLALTLDGRDTTAAGEPFPSESVDGGHRFTVEVGDDDEVLELVARGGVRSARFRLDLRWPDLPPWFGELYPLARSNAAAARVELERRLPATSGLTHAYGLHLLASLADTEADRQHALDQALDELQRLGSRTRWTFALEAKVHAAIGARRFGEARRQLDRLAELATDPATAASLPAEALLTFEYQRGMLATGLGDFRTALAAQTAASDIARRVDDARYRIPVDSERAETLQWLGRGAEADALLRQLGDLEAFARQPPCRQAEILNTHAWVRILAEGALGDPRQILDRADRLASSDECSDRLRLDLGLNRAFQLAQQGGSFEARRRLADLESERATAGTLHQLWWHDLEGRLALAEADPAAALDHYRAMEELSSLAFDPWGRWRAMVQQALALETLGREEEAVNTYAQAMGLLDQQSLSVPLQSGREYFVADRELGARRQIDLLLRLDRQVDAFQAARRSRSRLLRSIQHGHRLARLEPEQQAVWDAAVGRYRALRQKIEDQLAESWRRTGEEQARLRRQLEDARREALGSLDRAFGVLASQSSEPPALRQDELVLAYHPLPVGWAGFAARRGPAGLEVTAARLPLEASTLDPAPAAGANRGPELAEALLRPFHRMIAASPRLRVLAHGPLHAVDFHSLPWDGAPLLATHDVVYGLDLGPRRATAVSERARDRRALIVGDPTGDLPAARREAEVVATALGRTDRYDEIEWMDDRMATVDAVRERLPQIDLLHLAGHSRFAGESAWHSALQLADRGSLTLGDVLALDRSPRQVVLSSCEGARQSTVAPAGLGLAQAFLLAGASQVVAAARPVGDHDTATLFRSLYDGDGSRDLAQRLRHAQLAWRRDDPGADWSSFRVLEP